MEALIKISNTINKYLSCAILVTMVVFVAGNTFLRYFLDSGIIITEEFVRYLFLWGVYLGVISVWFNRQHIRVTTVVDRLSPRGKIYFSLVFGVVNIIVLAVLCVGSIQYYLDTTTVGQVTGIPYSVMILAVIVSTAACVLISIGQMAQDYKMLQLSDETLLQIQKEAEEALEKSE